MQIKQETRDFVAKLQPVDGWLYDDNIWVTAAVFGMMAKAGVRGPNFEIGVYKGKYLSAIHHCACTYHEPTLTVGLDAYLFDTNEQDAADTWTRMFGNTLGLKAMRGDSMKTKPDEIIGWCDGMKPIFISIDGDHRAWPVLNDHVICADALAQGGVLSSDDFCNWSMIGLMDGIARFFIASNQHKIVPFAFCMNKLYSCHVDFHDRYMAGMKEWCEANPTLQPAARFLQTRTKGMHWVVQELFGADCLIV